MRLTTLCAALCVAVAGELAIASNAIDSNSSTSSKNVILIIGDGMDDQQITIARNYLKGARGRLNLDQMPIRSTSQVLTVSNENPEQPVYVADSANSATSLATGVVTSRGRIATSAKHDQDIPTIIELAQQAGLKTGIVSTASVTDATPASFIAHIEKRFCENPTMMIDGLKRGRFPVECEEDVKARGGLGSISEQLADSQVDVILGGGMKHFDLANEAGDKTVLQQARDNGFHIISQAQELANAPADKKLLGLFAPSTLPVKLQGDGGRIAEAPEKSLLNHIYKYLGTITQPTPMTCEDNPAFNGMATLKAMTDTAIARLENDKGFFLVIESASIDKESHSRNPCGSLGEVEQLTQALDSALSFAEQQGNTLVMVTADHGQAAQIIPHDGLFSTPEMGNFPSGTVGAIARIKTPEGSLLGVNYATNDIFAEEHTGVNVPLLANETGRHLIKPMVTQPDIFEISAKFLGLK